MKRVLATAAIGLGLTFTTFAGNDLPLKAHPDSKTWKKLFADDLSDGIFKKEIMKIKTIE